MSKLNAKQRAFQLLARRNHTRQELMQKLSCSLSETIDSDEVNAALDYIESLGLLDHADFALHYVYYRASRGVGPLKIRYELKKKGLNPEEIQVALQHKEVNWEDNLRILHEKKFKAQIPSDIKEREKQRRFLLSRGFPDSMIQQLLIPSPRFNRTLC